MIEELFDYEDLIESIQESENLEARILKSKIQSVNNYIENLLHKKARIDLEIKRQRKTLSKLKKKSSTYLKLSLQVEDSQVEALNEETILELSGKENFEVKDLIELNRETCRLNTLLEEVINLQERGLLE